MGSTLAAETGWEEERKLVSDGTGEMEWIEGRQQEKVGKASDKGEVEERRGKQQCAGRVRRREGVRRGRSRIKEVQGDKVNGRKGNI